MLKALLTVLLLGANLPFPAPKVSAVTDDTKFASGTIASVDTQKGEFKVTTPAGIVTFRLSPAALLVGANGQATSLAALHAGQNVYVYYLVQNGAVVAEVDAQD
jgi:hypothetical protein